MKNRMQILTAVVVAAVLSFMFAACTGEVATDAPDANSVNLIPLHTIARLVFDTGRIDFDSLRTSYHFVGGGWSTTYPDEELGTQVIMAVKKFSRLRYNIMSPADRWLVFNISAQGMFGGPESQDVEVFVGEERVASFEISGASLQEQAIFIPERLQREGDNFIDFRYSEFIRNPKYELSKNERRKFAYQGIAAHFSDIRFVPGDENGPQTGAAWEESQMFEPSAENRMLRQRPDSLMTFAFDRAHESSFAFSGMVEAGQAEEEVLSVLIQYRTNVDREWNELWGKSIQIGGSSEPLDFSGELDFGDFEDDLYELRFAVMSSLHHSDSSVVWRSLDLTVPPVAPSTSAETVTAKQLPPDIKNVVIIVCDALRADLIRPLSDGAHTSTISGVADESIVFTNAVAAAPYTVASISSLFSSLIPDAHGVRRGRSTFPDHLDTMAKSFVRKDYYTLVMAGLPFIKRKFGITKACEKEVYLRSEEDRRLEISRMDLNLMRQSVREANDSGKPVFIYTHLLPPHWPYNPPPPFGNPTENTHKELSRKRRQLRQALSHGEVDEKSPEMLEHFQSYLVNLEYADFVVGEIITALKDNGMYENTLLILAADHGEAFGEHNSMGHSSTVYESMIRVPLVVHYPGVEHRVIDQQVGLIDLYPTIAELMKLDIENPHIQGRSLAPMFTGNDQPAGDYYYSRAVDYTVSLKIDDVEHVFVRTRFMMRGETFKYIFNDWTDELYDITRDPQELNNLAELYPALVTNLRQRGLALITHAESINVGIDEAELGDDEEELRNLGYLQ